jgi:hypothetical protein
MGQSRNSKVIFLGWLTYQNCLYPKILLYCYVIDTSKLVIPKKCYFTVTWLTYQNCLYPKILLGCYLIDTSKLVIPKKYYFTVTWLTHQNCLYPKNITLLLRDWHIKTGYTQQILLYCYVIDTSKLVIPKKYYFTVTWLTHKTGYIQKYYFTDVSIT